LRPVRSNALLRANKKDGKVPIEEDALKLFDNAAGLSKHLEDRSQIRSKSSSPSKEDAKKKNKGKKRKPDDEDDIDDDDADSGDEAELLNDEQLNELDRIYQRCGCDWSPFPFIVFLTSPADRQTGHRRTTVYYRKWTRRTPLPTRCDPTRNKHYSM
jgi:hypothetical protein